MLDSARASTLPRTTSNDRPRTQHHSRRSIRPTGRRATAPAPRTHSAETAPAALHCTPVHSHTGVCAFHPTMPAAVLKAAQLVMAALCASRLSAAVQGAGVGSWLTAEGSTVCRCCAGRNGPAHQVPLRHQLTTPCTAAESAAHPDRTAPDMPQRGTGGGSPGGEAAWRSSGMCRPQLSRQAMW